MHIKLTQTAPTSSYLWSNAPSRLLCVSLAALAVITGCSTRPERPIEVAKIKPPEILTGPYSFFVPPYSYYYFHHMDQLGFRLNWIRHEGPVYALQ